LVHGLAGSALGSSLGTIYDGVVPSQELVAREGGKPQYPIGSVDRALRLLLLFSERRQLRIADASREIEVAHSTAHRLLQMLKYHGFATQDPESKSYSAGPVLVRIGLAVARNLDIRSIARPFVQELVDDLHETTHLVALQGADVICLDSQEGARAVRVASRSGMLLPGHASASGLALLADLPLQQLRQLYPQSRLHRYTANTIVTRKGLEEELARTRERGYAVNVASLEPDVGAVAAPIRGPNRQATFAITVAVPCSRLSDEDIPSIATAAIETASKIAAALPW
jgi:IclR family transcriptional regulator, acetate operon repressor